jgi:16S rRNA (uracil1498-N3)-methyltransferase
MPSPSDGIVVFQLNLWICLLILTKQILPTMDYFYTPPSLIKGRSLSVQGEELHHLSKVLRKKVGEAIIVVDGEERAYKAVLESVSRSSAECKILQAFHRLNEPDIEVKLAFALLKNPSRVDFLVEKCTELGVREFIPMRTERTIVSKVHAERLQKIALSAMKQCGRSFLSPIHSLMSFLDALTYLKDCEGRFIMHERASQGSAAQQKTNARWRSVGVLVGPEGGFTEEEVQAARSAGFVPFSLGPRRLRSETAAIASVNAMVMGL